MFTRIDSNEIVKTIKAELISKYDSQPVSVRKSVQLLQETYHCCGVDGWKDYGIENITSIPNSCCSKYDDTVFGETDPQIGKCNVEDLKNVGGCKQKVIDTVQENSKSFLIAIGCVFGFQILVVILSCVLSKSIREQYNVV